MRLNSMLATVLIFLCSLVISSCSNDELAPISLKNRETANIKLNYPNNQTYSFPLQGGDGNYEISCDKPEIIETKMISSCDISIKALALGEAIITVRDQSGNTLDIHVLVAYDPLRRHGDVRHGIRRSRFHRTQAHFFNQLGKFQLQKQGIRRRCRLLHPVFRRVKGQRRISDNGGQPVGMAGCVLSRRQLFDGGGLGVDIRKLFINGVHAAIFLNKIHSGLFTHPRYAGNIVGGVSHQGLQVDHADGREAVLLPERVRSHLPGGGLAHPGGHQLHPGPVADELEGVLVPGDDHRLPAGLLVPGGDGADQVVRLPAVQLIPGDAHGVQHLLQHRELPGQLLGHGFPLGLVALVGQMPEGGGLPVKGDAQGVRILLPLQLQQDVEKAENGVGGKAIPGGQGPDPVKGAVDNGISIQHHQFHAKSSLRHGMSAGALPETMLL